MDGQYRLKVEVNALDGSVSSFCLASSGDGVDGVKIVDSIASTDSLPPYPLWPYCHGQYYAAFTQRTVDK